MRLVLTSVVLAALAACGGEPQQERDAVAMPVAGAPTAAPPGPTNGSGDYLDDLHECLNAKGYNFVKGADGSWNGKTGEAGEAFTQAQKRLAAAEAACQEELGFDSQPRPAPSAS